MLKMFEFRGADEAKADRVARQKRAEAADRIEAGAETLEQIRKHPIYIEAQTQARASRISDRSALRAQIGMMQAELAAKRRELSNEASRAKAEAEALDLKAKAARRRAADAQAAMLVASSSVSAACSRVEHELRSTADPAIAAFVDETLELINSERGKAFGEEREGPETGGSRKHFVFGNSPSLVRRQAAMRSAIASAQAMALEVDQGDVPNRLKALRAGLPAIEEGITERPQVRIVPDKLRNGGRYRDLPERERSIFGRAL